MSEKAVAIHATVLVILMAVFIFAIFVIFFNWINIQNLQASKELCATKLLNYCTEWWKKDFKDKPYNWAEQSPVDCEKDPINIHEPTDVNDCRALLGIK